MRAAIQKMHDLHSTLFSILLLTVVVSAVYSHSFFKTNDVNQEQARDLLGTASVVNVESQDQLSVTDSLPRMMSGLQFQLGRYKAKAVVNDVECRVCK